MWRTFTEYFHFTKKERKGIIVLITIILILTAFPFFFPFFIKDSQTDFSVLEQEIAQLKIDSSTKKIYISEYNKDNSKRLKKKEKIASS